MPNGYAWGLQGSDTGPESAMISGPGGVGFLPIGESSAPRHRPHDEERLGARLHGLGKRGIRRVLREVAGAGEEAHERATAVRVMIAHRSAQHRIARFERVEHGTCRD